MSKSFRNVGIGIASICGVLTAYATFRPALEEQRAERLGHDIRDSKAYGTVISDQMRQDFREAEKEFRNEGGFAWGIRQALFGRNPHAEVNKESDEGRVQGKAGDSEGGKG